MTSARNLARIIGVLVLVHLATGLIVPYVMLRPLMALPFGFLETAAEMSNQVRWNVMALFVGGAIPIGITVAAWPIFRLHCSSLSLWLLVLAGVNLSLQAVENGHWLSMLSLSQAHAEAGATDAERFQSLAVVVRTAFRWAHYSHIFAVVAWIFAFYALLYRSALVPRILAGSGLVTCMMQFTGITLPAFLDYRMPYPTLFGMPLAVVNVALAFWLMSKGFRQARVALADDSKHR
jgi:hypothetical protein